MKKLFGALVAVGVMALMAVGVQAATYSATAGAAPGADGYADVNVMISPDGSEAEAVNGYIIELEYDSSKINPVVAGKDASDADCYAEVGTDFADGVLVADDVETKTNGNMKTLAVSWATADAVNVDTAGTVLADVKFEPTETFTSGSASVDITVVALTSDGEKLATSEELDTINAAVANGSVTISSSDFELGDVNLSGGAPDITDVTTLYAHVTSIKSITDPEALALANVDGKDGIDITDVTTLYSMVTSLI